MVLHHLLWIVCCGEKLVVVIIYWTYLRGILTLLQILKHYFHAQWESLKGEHEVRHEYAQIVFFSGALGNK